MRHTRICIWMLPLWGFKIGRRGKKPGFPPILVNLYCSGEEECLMQGSVALLFNGNEKMDSAVRETSVPKHFQSWASFQTSTLIYGSDTGLHGLLAQQHNCLTLLGSVHNWQNSSKEPGLPKSWFYHSGYSRIRLKFLLRLKFSSQSQETLPGAQMMQSQIIRPMARNQHFFFLLQLGEQRKKESSLESGDCLVSYLQITWRFQCLRQKEQRMWGSNNWDEKWEQAGFRPQRARLHTHEVGRHFSSGGWWVIGCTWKHCREPLEAAARWLWPLS